MAFDFPSSPSIGATYTPGTGLPVYRWDGEKWLAQVGSFVKNPVWTDGTAAMTAQLTLFADPVANTDAADKHYVDTGDTTLNTALSALSTTVTNLSNTAMLKAGNQTVTGGFNVTPFNLGTIASFTPNPLSGNYQYGTNNAAFTLTAPTTDCGIDILVTNGATAGAITFSGFTVGALIGDALTTTNGSKFIISIRRINAVATYIIKALQ